MVEFLRVLALLLHKNLLVRKRLWKSSLIGEIIVPVGLIVSIWAVRNFTAKAPVKVDGNSYFPSVSKENIIKLNMGQSRHIYYAPNNSFTDELMNRVMLNFLQFSSNQSFLHRYSTEKELVKDFQKNDIMKIGINAAVIFDSSNTNMSTKHLSYKIRTKNLSANKLYNLFRFREMFSYYSLENFFVPLQLCIDESFIKMNLHDALFYPKVFVQRLPYPPHTAADISDQLFRQLFGAITIIAFMVPLFIETSQTSNEKFLGVNVLMSMNGVANSLNLLSWLISGVIFISLFCITPIILVLLYSTGDALPYLYYGNPFIIWLAFAFYIMHLLSYGIHVSAYFTKALHVIFGLLILYICSMILQLYGLKESDYPLVPYLGILFPNLLLYRVIEEFNYYEIISEGIHWNNLFLVGDPRYEVGGSVGMILILFLAGVALHFLLACYIYAINPGKYGVRKSPLFFLEYFRQTKNKIYFDDTTENLDYQGLDEKLFELIPSGRYVSGIQVRNLKKSYKISLFNNSKIHALRDISIDFYKGQITSLLGHNGAGKTTMMSILSGMMSSSQGMVLINSKNIKNHSREIMNDMGLCTQENMVFPKLSIIEQLQFFAMLKKKDESKSEIDQDVKLLLKKLKLTEKINVLPEELSGGQKRRLCLGMALAGSPGTLILDEPTSGLDPESRRVIWDIILKMRKHKTILISTHDMEEADILGDRIAILHTGQLKSYGTSMFLKKSLGEGNVEVTLSLEAWCNVDEIRSALNCESKIINKDGSKLVLTIPNSPDLPDTLDSLERKKTELAITGLSVSLISLEQVFLQVTQEERDIEKIKSSINKVDRKLTDRNLLLQTIHALFKKKVIYTKKNLSTIVLMIFLIFIGLACISFILKESNFSKAKENIIFMNLDMYNQPETYYKSYKSIYGAKYNSITKNMSGKANEAQHESVSTALLNYAKNNLFFYDNHLIAAAEFNQSNQDIIINALYSNKAIFSFPISINLISNVLTKSVLGDEYSISISAQKLSSLDSLVYLDLTLVNAFTTAVTFVFFFYPTVAMFIIHPLRESSTNVKQLQRMTLGVSSFIYWGTIFIIDLILFLLLIILNTIGFYCMDYFLELQVYGLNEILILLLLFVMFAFNSLPFIYIFSFLNTTPNAAVRLLTYIPIGLVALEIVMYTANVALYSYEVVKIIRVIQKRIFLLIPYVSFFHSQTSFYITAQTNARCKRMPNIFYDSVCKDKITNDVCCSMKCYNGECKIYKKYFNNFDGDMNLEESMIYLAIMPILYIGILAILEYQMIQKILAKIKRYNIKEYPIDEQVKEEKSCIEKLISPLNENYLTSISSSIEDKTREKVQVETKKKSFNPIFFVYELRKKYGNVLAVQDVSFSVNRRECFGLLGVNGAGKSTTFRIMTGGEIPDNGIMFIDDKSKSANRKYFLSQMGYCPQKDAIIKCLNSYDHLRLFARLRGVPEDLVESETKTWIDRLNLNGCAYQPSGTYSGGNKRRLNIAMALIGVPKLVLLDEPTTGVDPGARRSLWNVIQSCQDMGQAVVLTSHSMEECEALCNRLAIMVGGKLVCIGASQELKQRFGAGYNIEIKMNPEKAKEEIDSIKTDMAELLICELIDEHSGYLMYHVMPNEISWRKMYNAMNIMKSKYDCIDDYSVLSSTLEQLFLLFARGSNKDPKGESG